MKNKAIRIGAIVFAAFLLLGVLFYFVAGDSLHFTKVETSTVSQKDHVDLEEGYIIEQLFECQVDELHAVSLYVNRGNVVADTDHVVIQLLDTNGNLLRTVPVSVSAFPENAGFYTVSFDPITEVRGEKIKLRVIAAAISEDTSVSLYFGNSVDTGRYDLPTQIPTEEILKINGVDQKDPEGTPFTLCLKSEGTDLHFFGPNYWYFYAGGALLFALYLLYLLIRYRKGKPTLTIGVLQSLSKYNFLIRQLVSRDFKTKYKRSVLGMLWSFLNPLLTMSIQYVVFGFLFSSDAIENFVVYLLCGIVCFNFFNETANMCLMSIIGNASLINKVYVPKYIYPFSRTLSSSINLLLSLIPLFIMLLITGEPITPAFLLLPLVLLMLFMLSYGVGLILATLMVFFRDTQFLWGIFSMLLMYLTPIFYPESIIPAQFMSVYKLNPLYHILRFMRSILIDGVSLEPKAYLYCFALCALPFLIGILVFRKNQDKFVLNI